MKGDTRGFDPIAWFIFNTHRLIGHDKAAAVCGQAPGPRFDCVLCCFERGDATRTEVLEAIGVPL